MATTVCAFRLLLCGARPGFDPNRGFVRRALLTAAGLMAAGHGVDPSVRFVALRLRSWTIISHTAQKGSAFLRSQLAAGVCRRRRLFALFIYFRSNTSRPKD